MFYLKPAKLDYFVKSFLFIEAFIVIYNLIVDKFIFTSSTPNTVTAPSLSYGQTGTYVETIDNTNLIYNNLLSLLFSVLLAFIFIFLLNRFLNKYLSSAVLKPNERLLLSFFSILCAYVFYYNFLVLVKPMFFMMLMSLGYFVDSTY